MHRQSSDRPDVHRMEAIVRELSEQIDAIRGEFTDAVWEAERVLREVREVGVAATNGVAPSVVEVSRLGEDANDAREGLKISFSEAMASARQADSALIELRSLAAKAMLHRAA
jgi:hypothetical protein